MKIYRFSAVDCDGRQLIKGLIVMKLIVLFIFASFFQVQAGAYAQRVSLSEKNVALVEVLKQIKRQTNYNLICKSRILRESPLVSIEVKNASLEEALNKILKPNGLTYVIEDMNVVIKKAPKLFAQPTLEKKVLDVALQQEVTGKVTDEQGSPLAGVTVTVKNTQIVTTTDDQGQFVIRSAEANPTLVFSIVGFSTEERTASSNTVNVSLQASISDLDEVVVVGYGTQKRKDVSTAISSVSAKDIEDQPVSNFASAITGKMAGVRILNSNNAPGGGTNIVIRGINSINASNSPLIVIDGFPLKDEFNKTENPLNAVNPADIASIEVLKDASSSAIYGARAANGVILITTKKGQAGKPTINVEVNTGVENMTNRIDVLNREDFLQFMDDARAQAYIVEDPNFGTDDPNAPLWSWSDDNETRIYNWTNFSSMKEPMAPGNTLYNRWATVTDETKAQPYDTDWQDVATKTGNVQSFQLSTTGGTEKLKYMISGGYFNQDGITEATGYDRFSFRANVELKINDWIKTGLLLAPSMEDLDVMSGMEASFFDIIRMPPLYTPYDENGDPKFLGGAPGDWRQWNLADFVNPLMNPLIQDNRRTVKNLSTIFAEVNIIEGLTLRSEFHTEFRNNERNYFLPSNYPTTVRLDSRSRGLNNITSRLYWNSQNFLTYNKMFGRHSLNAILGYSAEEATYRGSYIDKYDYATDQVPTLNQAITILNAQNDARTNRSSETMIGSFARAMYNYDGKYYLTGSVRRDGSSKFGADKKWGIFPSFSAAWRISGEQFFEPLKPYVNDLKIRGGWGVIGNSGIGNYNALSTLTAKSYFFESGSTVSPGYADGKVANPTLGWESTTDYGLGIDAEFLNGRASLSVDYFYKLTEDMLFSMPLPTITGFGSYMVNIGSMRNRGFEYMIRSNNLTGQFKWTTAINMSYYRNRVLNTGKDKRPLINNNAYTTEGKPLAGIWGTYFLGPYSDWEDVKTNPIVNSTNPDWMYRSAPGTSKLYDVNGDGVIDGLDNTIIGTPNPDFIWGMTNTFAYKGFDLSVQVNGVQGGDHLLTQMESIMARSNGTTNTVYEYYNNYWRPDRPNAKYAAPTRKSWDGTSNRGTLLFKGTYVNIQNIALGYTLPKALLQKMNLESIGQIRVNTSIQNAFIFTNYPSFNPEVNYQGDSALSQGMDNGAYPMTRTVSFGINVSL